MANARWGKARKRGKEAEPQEIRLRPLTCGHMPDGPPPVSNPRQWFCATCREWKKMR